MEALSLIHSVEFTVARYADALRQERVSLHPIDKLDDLKNGRDGLNVLLLDQRLAPNGKVDLPVDVRIATVGLGLQDSSQLLSDERIYFHLPANPSAGTLLSALRRTYQHLAEQVR